MSMIVKFVLSRLAEASTWRGIISLITSLGVALNPEQISAIIAAGLGVVGLIAVFFPDKAKATTPSA